MTHVERGALQRRLLRNLQHHHVGKEQGNMKRSEGRALGTLLGICEELLKRVDPEQGRSYVDGLSDAQMADVHEAQSAASAARGSGPDLFCESTAARLRGIDVERYGSGQLGPDAAAEVADQAADRLLRNSGIKTKPHRARSARASVRGAR